MNQLLVHSFIRRHVNGDWGVPIRACGPRQNCRPDWMEARAARLEEGNFKLQRGGSPGAQRASLKAVWCDKGADLLTSTQRCSLRQSSKQMDEAY